jgi:hypothetical protein
MSPLNNRSLLGTGELESCVLSEQISAVQLEHRSGSESFGDCDDRICMDLR